MVGLDGPSRILQDKVLLLDDAIGRQPALAFPQAHRAPAGLEADADLLRGPNLVVNAVAALGGIDVEVVGRGGAAGEHQLGQPHQRAGVDRLRGQPGPDGVERLEPLEQGGVLRSGHGPGQGLVEVVVGVDQPRQDDHPAGVNDPVGLGGQLGGRPDLLETSIARKQAAVGDAIVARFVHRHQ